MNLGVSMFYTIYKITNQINGKYYIGKHQTMNLNDGYMGSGKLIKRAIDKYGVENFKKEILHIFDNEEDMNAKEKELVVINESIYNVCDGGHGGFGYINKNGLYVFSDKALAKLGRELSNKKLQEKYGDDWRKVISKLGSAKGTKAYLDKLNNDPIFKDKMLTISKNGRLAALSDSAKEKRKATMAMNNHQKGSKNSQFGKCWITDGKSNKMVKIQDLDTYFKVGYYRGRTYPLK